MENWQRAEIHFIGWEVRTRASLTAEDVRRLTRLKCTFRRDAPEIARWLACEKLKPARDKRPEDARLVVDLFTDTGARVTYYASQFNLCTADSASKRPIDGKFRRHFRLLAE